MRSGHIDNRQRASTPSQVQGSPVDEAVRRAVGFLARQDRTVAQVEKFLAARGAPPSQIKHVIRRLTDLQYLSDQDYARRWVERRLSTRPMGPERLKVELQAKGIPDALAGRVVAGAFRTVKEETVAHQAVHAKQGHGRPLTPVQVERLLRQRGFEDDTIERVIRERQRKEERVHEE